MTVCRASAAVTLEDNRTDKFVMPVFSLNVINDGSRAINRLACLEFNSVPTRAGTEVYQEHARRDACNVADMTGSPPSAQDSNEPLCFLTDSLDVDQCLAALRMKSRLMNAKCPFDHHDAQECPQPNFAPKLVVTGNVLHHDRVKCVFWFLGERDVDALKVNGHEVLVRASHFDGTSS